MADESKRVTELSAGKLRRLMSRLAERQGTAAGIPRAPRGGAMPLSFAQERLWFLNRLGAGGAAYHIPAALRLCGPLDALALERTLDVLVSRHEALRTAFGEENGRPVQTVHNAVSLALPRVDLSALPEDLRARELARITRDEASRPFDLTRAPLLRALLVRLGSGDHRLVLAFHHIVTDGWSLGVLVREVAALYPGLAAGAKAVLPELPIQPADHAVWERERLRGEAFSGELAFWRERLAGLPSLELPADRPRPAAPSFQGALATLDLPAETARALEALAQRERATPFMALLALFQALLLRYTGQSDFGVGTPVANRTRSEVEGLIGLLVNTLVLRVDLSGRPGFAELLRRAREVTLAAFAHEELPFEKLVQELRPEREPGRNPLFQVLFTLQNQPWPKLRMGELDLELTEVDTGTARADLTLLWRERDGGLAGALEYSTDLFERASAERLLGYLAELLRGALADPEREIWDLPLLAAAERRQILVEWRGSVAPYPRDATVHELFEEQAAAAGRRVAVEAGDVRLTYAELESRANQLARHLCRLGVGPDSPVGLAVPRSPEMVVGLLGILKAGGAYLPLDPAVPRERLAALAGEARLQALVTLEPLLDRLPGGMATVCPIVCLDRDREALAAERRTAPTRGATADNLVYVLYTSGSTGQPKGVAVPHRGVVRLVRGGGFARLDAGQVLLQLAPLSFDASTLEIWGALCNGAQLVMAPPEPPSLSELGGLLTRHGVTTLWLTAGLFHQMVDEGIDGLRGLSQLLAGGDVLSPLHVRRAKAALPGCDLINGYGPTENTTFTCCHPLVDAPADTPVPIGRPIANTSVMLLDRTGRPVPVGVPGELYTGGDGLARGYLGRPEQTAERFVPSPLAGTEDEPGARLYRTGDLARWRPDGTLDFLGRLDQQVKIRGFRIEPGEIEAALAAHPGIAECAVVVHGRTGEDRRLVAWLVAREEGAPEPAGLRVWLAARLPAYMMPAAFTFLDTLPLNPNGKVDRRALARLQLPSAEARGAEPETPLEVRLAAIWSDLLGQPRIGRDDDFFALGGHSLLATRVVSRLREEIGIELPLVAIFENATLAGLAAVVERTAGSAPDDGPIPAAAGLEEAPLSFSQERLWFLAQLRPGSATYNIPAAVRLSGALDPAVLAACFGEIVRRHATLRTTFPILGGEPRQRVAPAVPVRLPRVDLAALPEEARSREARRLHTAEAAAPFDLAAGPLLRTILLRLGPDEHLLLLTIHHIVADGWSVGILVREIAALYTANPLGQPSPLPELPIQYADFALWQRRRLEGAALAGELDFWRERLHGAPPELALPTDRPHPAAPSGRAASWPLRISGELAEGVRRLARSAGATPFMVLLAAFEALLSRLSDQTDLTVGTSVAGRQRAEVEGLIGFFVNTLVLRADLAGAPSFDGFLSRTRRHALEAFAHQELPFEKLVELLQPERNLGQTPLFQAFFALQNAPVEPLRLPGLAVEPLPEETGAAKFDLTLALAEEGPGFAGVLAGSADLLEETTVRRWAEGFERLLAAALRRPEERVLELPLLGDAERETILHAWSSAGWELPVPVLIHELFAEQAARTPGKVAAVCRGEALTYRELDERAGRLARYIQGYENNALVGLMAAPDLPLLAGMLGILKAGSGFVPLDPGLPAERIERMIADCGLTVVAVDRESLARFPAVAHRVCLDDEPEPLPEAAAGAGDGTAYVIFTSGSTGVPKGVPITHENLVPLLLWSREVFGFGESTRVLQSLSCAFDFGVFEILTTLLFGGTIYLRGDAERSDLEGYVREVRAHSINTLHTTPSFFRAVAAAAGAEGLPTVEVLHLGGEALTEALVAEAFRVTGPECRLFNGYGPTEAAVNCALYEVGRAADWRPRGLASLPIGHPSAANRLYALDRRLQPVPTGVPGELLVGGPPLSRGYLGRPDLTATRFVPDPFGEPGGRLYRTGDLVRFHADGAIEFLGRVDNQVKIRGYRIELEEIEAALAAHPEVGACAVAAVRQEGGEARLVAYVAARQQPPESAELRRFLGRTLPAHMVPAVFAFLPELPLNANGKVDRKALARLQPPSAEARRAAPETPLERRIAAVWSDLLGQPRISRDDDFFALGGHSLLATRVVSRLREELGVELPLVTLFENPILAGLAAAVKREGEALPGGSLLLAAAGKATPPLSFAQERLWFLEQLQPGSAAYNVPAAVRLAGALDPKVLAACFGEIVRRHATLRTTFPTLSSEPHQQVAPAAPVPLPLVDLAELPEETRSREVLRRTATEARAPFDLAAGPLLRTTLLRLGADEHLLLLTLHHIASDGWSAGILVRETAVLYTAFAARRPSPLPELPVQYTDFALWQRRRLSGDLLESELRFWSERLRGAPPELALPTDRPRPAVVSERGTSCRLRLSARWAEEVRTLALQAGATPFMVLLAAFEVLLARLSGQTDLTVGTPVAGRQRAEIEGLIGFFANTLVLRADLADAPSFAGLLARTRRHALEAYAHQELPFEKLVVELQPGRNLGRTPLFQASLVLQNAPVEPLRLPGLAVELLPVENGTAKFDLSLALAEDGDGFFGELTGSADLFEDATIERWAGCFEQLLTAALQTPGKNVFELPLLSEAERRTILEEWSSAGWERPASALIHELFAVQAARTPDKIAAVCRGEALSYQELDERAGRLARRLAGFEDRALVGLMAAPDLPLLTGMLGILKAGSGFVPLAPDLPAERLERMTADCGLAVIAADRRSLVRCPAVANVVCLDDEPEPLPPVAGGAGDGTAYVIFTSGSTGVPKGVPITHENLVPLLLWSREVFGFGEPTRVLQSLSYTFDFGVFEILTTLLFGGTLFLRGDAERSDVEGYLREVRSHGINTLHATPSFFRAVAAAAGGERLPLEVLHLGGEALNEALVTEAFKVTGPECRLFNGYGPTEAAVNCALYEVGRAADWRPRGLASLPIGHPSAANRLYVLDHRMQPVPVGVPGELLVGGAALSRGYLGRPDLTATRFVPDPFDEPGGRLYRTGDLVRFHTDRAIEFLGRVDNQVKVRGYRIELEEIEAALAAHPEVGACAVAAVRQEGGEARLLAYVAARREPAPGIDELRRFLSRMLPTYMVPAAFVFLPELPMNASGKVDRKALPAPDWTAGTGWIAPRTPLEELLAGLWEELLGRERVGARDDFFELGGHSLLATRLLARLRATLGVDLPVRRLFEAPTVEALAAAIEGAEGGTPLPALLRQPRRPGEDPPLSFSQERLWFLDRLDPGAPTYNMPGTLGLAGRLDVAVLASALCAVVERHEVLRTVFPVVDGEPRQHILPALEIGLPVIDLVALPPAGRLAEAQRLAAERARHPFDLARGPLLDAALLRLEAERHHLLVVLHHVICDGWSLALLVHEVGALYAAFTAGRLCPLPELPVQYADFTVWQREVVAESQQAELAWWLERLSGEIAPLELPTDRPRPALQIYRGGHAARVLHAGLASRLIAFSRAHGATLFMKLLAAIQALLHRHSGQDDILVGAPVAGRRAVETEELIGCFLNTLVLRTDLGGQPGFRELVARVREVTLGAYSHQDVPFEAVLATLPQPRDLSRTPLFQVMVNLLNLPKSEMRLPGLKVEVLALAPPPSKLDMTFYLSEGGGGLGIELVYNAGLFDAARMEDILAQLEALLDQALERPEEPVGALSLVTAAARAVLPDPAVELSATWEGAVHEVFARHAQQTPGALAVIDPAESWTYGELDERSSRLAAFLRASGVRPGDVVAFWAHRNASLVWSVLGALKVGTVFLMLDPRYPAPRQAQMLGIARPAAWLRVAAAGPVPPEIESELDAIGCACRLTLPARADDAGFLAEVPAERPAVDVGPDDVAYVAFTSGSTGMPKGVLGRHGSLSHFIPWLRARFKLRADDRYSMLSGLAHDPLHRDLFTPLQTGATVVIPDPDTMDEPGRLAAWMRREGVTIAHLTPALGQVLTTEAPNAPRIEVPSLRYVFLVGDVLTRRDVARLRRLAPAVTCINYYGSTETQRAVGYHVAEEDGPKEILPLGRGIPDVQLLVLNPVGALAGIGELGEISIRSPHIALGYLGDPQLTARRFVADLYRTGDLGRYLPNGEAVFVGRADTQVKIRGFRIELGEIEAVLGRFPGVREAVVIARQDRGPERYLAAYVVPAPGVDLAVQELRAFLRERLPDSMVPTTFTLLDELPLTPNRKVDRRALPAPEAPAGAEAFVAPRNPVEEVLAGLWAEMLGVERVGIDDNFFELGGHSLLATRLLARVRHAFGCDLPLRELFTSPTIAGLAARIEAARVVGSPPAAPPLCRAAVRPAELPLSFAQERFWLLEQLQPGGAYHIPFAVRLLGDLDVAALVAALDGVVRRHEVLHTAFPRRNGRPTQVVLPPAAPPLPLADLSALPAAAKEAESLRLAQETARRPFDLERGPLLRALLVRVGGGEHAASLAVHHAVFDGWSSALLIDELAILYAAARTSLPARLPELPVQAGDHALWQRDWLRGEALAMQRDFWRRTLAGAPPAVALPADPLPSGASRAEAVEVRSSLAPATVHALREQTQASGSTLFMALLAGLDALLYRWTGQEDLVIGTVLAERDRPSLERLIGCFVNFLPLRVRLDGDTSWRQLLERARDAALAAHAHRDLPFEQIVDAAGAAREPGRNPLYNVALLLQNVPRSRRFDASLEAHPLPLPSPGALLDLRLVAQETEDGGLTLRWEASGELCEPATVERLAAAYETTLAHLMVAPDEPVAAADLPWPGPEALACTAEPEQRRVIVAATFTADPVERALRFWSEEMGLPLDVALAPYGQLFQELVSPDGLFAHNRGGYNVGLVRLEDWRRPGESDPWSGVVRAAADLARAARGAVERTGTPFLLCLCPTSPRTLANPAAASALQRGEEQLAADLAGSPGVHLITAADLAALYPVAEPHDPRGDQLGHVPYTPAYFTALGTLVARRIWRLLTPPHKVIALDCDQTLWKGVCGEDGPLGIEIDPSRRELQEFLIAQREAGMLLCLCSKNNEADVEAVFRLRGDMPLRREHIAATSVSWQPKSRGLRALATELGLGLDSFIFLDDNPLEHADVEAEHPEVLTLLLPEDPEEIPGFLRHVWAFDHLEVTEEDRRRAESYRQNRERERLREEGMTLDEFLAELELEVEIGPITAAHLPRVAQLTQRTNQFNLTTIRRSESEIAGLLASGAREGRMVHVRDRFGDYGLVGVLLFTAGPRALEVETFLLSCRALGRRVEHRMVAALGDLSLERGLDRVDLCFGATERNRPAADFLEAVAGDVRHPADDGGWVFRLPAVRAAALGGEPAALATASPEEVDHV